MKSNAKTRQSFQCGDNMEIRRDRYLQQIIDYMWDGQVKVITGIRRCGKSYLLNVLFKNHLLEHGVKAENILSVELDLTRDIKYREFLLDDTII